MNTLMILARTQKARCNSAWYISAAIRLKLNHCRQSRSEVRRARYCLNDALELEQRMLTVALERPEDYEEWRNFDLAAAVSRLTLFRVNRLAYAGRVLP